LKSFVLYVNIGIRYTTAIAAIMASGICRLCDKLVKLIKKGLSALSYLKILFKVSQKN
jgi:hypothetical protein